TTQPPARSSIVRWTVASPAGHPRARRTSSRRGTQATTVVVSSISTGHTPTEWCSSLPTPGHPGSTARIRDAPTTQLGYSQPSARTAQTASGDASISRLTVTTPAAYGIAGSSTRQRVQHFGGTHSERPRHDRRDRIGPRHRARAEHGAGAG